MKMELLKLAIFVLLMLYIFLGDITITVSKPKWKYEIKYTGIVWVALDYWSIWKYKSDDKPMQIFSITKTVY